MARPRGSRDRDYADKRSALLAAARSHLSAPEGRRASFRDLAAACGVSLPTLRHYFGDRRSLVAEIMAFALQEGERYLALAAQPSGAYAQSIADLVGMISQGLSRGVLPLQVIGLGEGFADAKAGSAYLDHVLEPILTAITARLDVHVSRGEMRQVETRFAAIALLSPLLLAHLHQHALGGAADYPMPMASHDAALVDGFVRAYAAPAPAA